MAIVTVDAKPIRVHFLAQAAVNRLVDGLNSLNLRRQVKLLLGFGNGMARAMQMHQVENV